MLIECACGPWKESMSLAPLSTSHSIPQSSYRISPRLTLSPPLSPRLTLSPPVSLSLPLCVLGSKTALSFQLFRQAAELLMVGSSGWVTADATWREAAALYMRNSELMISQAENTACLLTRPGPLQPIMWWCDGSSSDSNLSPINPLWNLLLEAA